MRVAGVARRSTRGRVPINPGLGFARPTQTQAESKKFRRFLQRLERQAARTRPLRRPLYRLAGLRRARRVLDVGSGSGHVTRELGRGTRGRVVALDNDPKMLDASRAVLARARNVEVREGDAHELPFADNDFDLVVCNLLLMWAQRPQEVVDEMARVARPGGRVLASMEPDYGGKIHYPENPVVDQVFQGAMIERKGGDPHAGRKLRTWFVTAGLRTDVGLGNPEIPSCEEDLESYALEKTFYRRALRDARLNPRRIDAWERQYVASLRAGTQFNHLPMFYALGQKNKSAVGRRKG